MCVCVLSRSVVSDSLRPHGLTVAYQVPLPGKIRQEYWSGLPRSSPWDHHPPTHTRIQFSSSESPALQQILHC